jgi:hypothetical protein
MLHTSALSTASLVERGYNFAVSYDICFFRPLSCFHFHVYVRFHTFMHLCTYISLNLSPCRFSVRPSDYFVPCIAIYYLAEYINSQFTHTHTHTHIPRRQARAAKILKFVWDCLVQIAARLSVPLRGHLGIALLLQEDAGISALLCYDHLPIQFQLCYVTITFQFNFSSVMSRSPSNSISALLCHDHLPIQFQLCYVTITFQFNLSSVISRSPSNSLYSSHSPI